MIELSGETKQKDVIATIGLCVRNCALTINDAINSIINQDFSHELMELIFVDDGSCDKTLSIIRSSLPRINMQTKVFHQEWKGLGPTRNVVVNNARGKYIVWVDGDMILSRNYVRKQFDSIEQNERVAIARGMFRGLPQESIVADLENMEWLAADFLAQKNEKIRNKLHFCGGSIYRVEAIREVGGFDETLRGAGEDEEIESRLRKAGWLVTSGARVRFYEKRKNTWRALWNQYLWYGRSTRYFGRKRRDASPVSLLIQFSFAKAAYTLTGRRIAFLLPFEYCFKIAAWFNGFFASRLKK